MWSPESLRVKPCRRSILLVFKSGVTFKFFENHITHQPNRHKIHKNESQTHKSSVCKMTAWHVFVTFLGMPFKGCWWPTQRSGYKKVTALIRWKTRKPPKTLPSKAVSEEQLLNLPKNQSIQLNEEKNWHLFYLLAFLYNFYPYILFNLSLSKSSCNFPPDKLVTEVSRTTGFGEVGAFRGGSFPGGFSVDFGGWTRFLVFFGWGVRTFFCFLESIGNYVGQFETEDGNNYCFFEIRDG